MSVSLVGFNVFTYIDLYRPTNHSGRLPNSLGKGQTLGNTETVVLYKTSILRLTNEKYIFVNYNH